MVDSVSSFLLTVSICCLWLQ